MGWVYIAGGVTLFFLIAWRLDSRGSTTHGSARWLTIWEAYRKGLLTRGALIVGTWLGRLPVYANTPHAITFGWTGSGKGTSAILPNLLSYSQLFVNDPGGENTAVAIGAWRDRGYEVFVINPFGMFREAPWSLPTHSFNPLSILAAESQTFSADAMLIAEMLVTRTGSEQNSSLYFKDAAQSALRAMIMHIVTTEPAERRHLGTLYSYVNSDAAGWEALVKSMQANPVCDGMVAAEANTLERREAQASEEFSAVLSTAQQDLNWLADPLVRAHMARSDVDLDTLKGNKPGQTGGIISVVLPLEYSESCSAITRLTLGCAIWAMQRGKLAKRPALFVIDEAAALGKISRFPRWLSTLRKYRVALWPIFQNVGQVQALYGRGWQTFIANCGLKQFLGVGDIETAEYVEKLLGNATITTRSQSSQGGISTSEARRPLLTAEEIMRLGASEQIVLIGALKPLLITKTPFWEQSAVKGRALPNPYHAGTPRPSLRAAGADLQQTVMLILLWALAPHPAAVLLYLLGLALWLGPLMGG
mgnify:CR=1 FL=1